MTREEFCKKLIDSSTSGLEKFEPIIEELFDSQKQRENKSEDIFLEFLFLLVHMADRTVFKELGQRVRDDNMDNLAQSILNQVAKKLYGTLDKDAINMMTKILQMDLNDAHCAYSNCDSIMAEGSKIFSSNAIASKFARRICKVLDRKFNPEIIRQAILNFALISQELNLPVIVNKLIL